MPGPERGPGRPGPDENRPKHGPPDPDFEPITQEELDDIENGRRYKKMLEGDVTAWPENPEDEAPLEAAYYRQLDRWGDRRLEDARREIVQREERLQRERELPNDAPDVGLPHIEIPDTETRLAALQDIEIEYLARRYKRFIDGDLTQRPLTHEHEALLAAAYKKQMAREADRRLEDARHEIAQSKEEGLGPDESTADH